MFVFYFHFSRVVGRVLSYFCTGPALLYYVLTAGEARRASAEYLTRVLGPAPWPVRLARTFRHVFNFAASLIDRALLLGRGPGVFRWIEEDVEPVKAALREKQGMILLGSHLGNIEVAGAVLGTDSMVQVMADPMAEDMQQWLEARGDAVFPPVIRLDGSSMASLDLLRSIRDGRLVAMKSDRVFDDNHLEIDFLGAPARFPTGPLSVAAATGAPVVLVFCMKEGGRTYRIIIEEPRTFRFDRKRPRDEQLREWLTWYADRLEQQARRYPYQWYNFFPFWQRPIDS